MTDELLAYDPERMRSLAGRTRVAIEYLDATTGSDPSVVDAVAAIRMITHGLTTTWMPVFAGLGVDTSMTGWDGSGPGSMPAGGTRSRAADDVDDMTDEELLDALVQAASAETPSVMSGAPPVPADLLAELAERWDELPEWLQKQAILALLTYGSSPTMLLDGSLAFLEATVIDIDVELDPAFAEAVIRAVAECGEVSPELQALVDRIAVDYEEELVLAVNGVDDPGMYAAFGIDASVDVPPAAVAAFLAVVDPAARAAIEERTAFDTTGFSLGGSVVAESPEGGSWASQVGWSESAHEGYEGGGFVVANGEEWPIVVPTVTTEHGTYTADIAPAEPGEPSVSNLGGGDDGWTVVGCATGVERIVDAPGVVDYFMFAIAGTAVDLQTLPPNSGLNNVVVNPNGAPSLTGTPAPAGQVVNIPDVEEANATNAAVGVVNMTTNAGVVVTNLDNQRESAYSVVFEQNEDGRRRARVVTYNVAETLDGVVVVPTHLYVGDDGQLTSQLVSYGSPYDDSPPPPSQVEPFCLIGRDMDAFAIPDAAFP